MQLKSLLFSIAPVLSIAFSTECFSQEYWVPLSSPTTKSLNSVFFTDTLTGWAAGDSGTIIHTTTGGQSWITQQSGISTNISRLFMLNNQFGWAVSPVLDSTGFETLLLATTDGGVVWTSQNIPGQFFYAITFVDSLHGWTVGAFGAIFGSSDGGSTWFEATVDTTYHPQWELLAVKFFSPNYGYAVGGRLDLTGVVWRTTNGGQSWHPKAAGLEPLSAIHFFDSLNVLCIGGDFDAGAGLIRTSNAGLSWDYLYLGIWGNASALAFRTHAEAWSPLGFSGTYMFSPDSGQTWASFFSPNINELYDVTFPDSLHGFMVGNHGMILKYNSSPLGIKEEWQPVYPLAVKLLPNYPNPFNPSTTIVYELSEAGDVSIVVYDVTGRELRVISEGRKEAGPHNVEFNANGLASGVYQYQISVSTRRGLERSTRTMIVLR